MLGEGRLVNLALATGHPSRVMDGSFCNQVLAQITLFKEGYASKKPHERELYVKVLPKKLDEEAAALMVHGFGGTITKLTKEQQDYISVNKDGPLKVILIVISLKYSYKAEWQSGHAADCNSVYIGSIPFSASNL